MALVVKYRIGEVAKDFNVDKKEIGSIMGEFFTAPKTYMQVLADEELDVIFEYMTQHHQVESLEEIFNVAPVIAEPAPAPAAPASGETAKEKTAKNADAHPAGKAPQSIQEAGVAWHPGPASHAGRAAGTGTWSQMAELASRTLERQAQHSAPAHQRPQESHGNRELLPGEGDST